MRLGGEDLPIERLGLGEAPRLMASERQLESVRDRGGNHGANMQDEESRRNGESGPAVDSARRERLPRLFTTQRSSGTRIRKRRPASTENFLRTATGPRVVLRSMAEVQTQTEAGEMTQVFIEFVMMQAQNAALCLGQITDPRMGQPQVNIPLAKMFIDQLAVIRAKTAGNLSADEQKVIDSALDQMEQAFVHVVSRTEGFHPGESLAPDLDAPPPAAAETVAPEAAAPAPEAAPAASPAPAPEPPPEEGRKRFTKSYGA